MAILMCTCIPGVSSSSYRDSRQIELGPHPYDLIPLNISLEALSPNTVTLRLQASTNKFWGCSEKVAICKPKRKASEETNPACPLILDFQPPEPWEINFCGLSHQVCGILLPQPEQTNTFPCIRKCKIINLNFLLVTYDLIFFNFNLNFNLLILKLGFILGVNGK